MSKRILIIDDDQLVAKSVQMLLKRHGFETTLAHNAVEAVTLAAITEFDLVLSDVRMPGENGIIAIEKIKKIYAEKRIICGFILISGYAEEDTPAHAIRLGVTKFLFKPFDNDKLIAAIEDELEIVAQQKSARDQKEPAVVIPKISLDFKPYLKRAVITGIGVVAPNGVGREAFWKGIAAGQNCVGLISAFDASSYPTIMAAEVKQFDPHQFIDEFSDVKRMNRSSHFAVAAAKLALRDARYDMQQMEEMQVAVGSATSGIEYIEFEARALERGGYRKVKPYAGIAGFPGAISSEVSRAIKAKGLSITISTGCTSSTDAMGHALTQIQYQKAKAIVVGGADACITPGIVAAFCQMGAASARNHDYLHASRPFNKDRDGFVISEGAYFFILEELGHAEARNATIYGELVGYGATCDAWHMSRPHPSGDMTAQAIRIALSQANMKPEEIDIFEAYGNATPINDVYETNVVKKVFGAHAKKILMPSVKSMLGHPIGASGAQQVAAALLAFNEGVLHPTINYEIPDPECDLDYVANQARLGKFTTAVCNCLAFGSKNSCVVIKKFSNS